MSSKHFVNDPVKLVNDALQGVVLTNPAVSLDPEHKVIYRRATENKTCVSIVSGGGSGHEPSFADLVGEGLLTAAVAGTIFASPNTEQVYAALRGLVDATAGILVVVMNYTGDVLNFGVAVERAKAAGLRVEMLVVGDDVGVGRAKGGKVGRRGIAGTVLVQKVAGALAARGASLETVYKTAKLTAENVISVGASLDHVHIPGHVDNQTTLAADQVELGMGIHNESGFMKIKADLPSLVGTMLGQLLDHTDSDRAFLAADFKASVLLVNNLGGLSVLELSAITTEVVNQLGESYKIRPVRILSGTYMTSLNGPGFSISLLNVVETTFEGLSLVQLLDAPAEAKGWPNSITSQTWDSRNTATREYHPAAGKRQAMSGNLSMDSNLATTALTRGLKALIAAEPQITLYDTITGDGDCGFGLKRGADAILKYISERGLTSDVVAEVAQFAHLIENTMDGTSGALYTIFFHALVQNLSTYPAGEITTQIWAQALQQSCQALSKYTPAKIGDRTLIDALHPFVNVLSKESVIEAAKAAQQGAERTKDMKASLGRTVYVGADGVEGTPDPGAWGLSVFLSGLAGLGI